MIKVKGLSIRTGEMKIANNRDININSKVSFKHLIA